jgi:seryl-tRNA synthetase
MIDIARIRKDPEAIKDKMRLLGDEKALSYIDEIVQLDTLRRELLTRRDELQSQRNKLNKSVGRLRGDKKLDDSTRLLRAYGANAALDASDYERAQAILAGEVASDLSPPDDAELQSVLDALADILREISEVHNALNNQVTVTEGELNAYLLWIPNIPHDSVPPGEGEEDNKPWEPEGDLREFDFQPQAHWDLGPQLGMIDFERGVKIAGSRFYILKGWGARLQRALITFFLDMAREKGFTEVYVPYLVQEAMMVGSAQFPKFRDVVYEDKEADLYLLPTSEVAVTNMHRDEIFNEADLPKYYVAHTPCFRREKASAGRDTRGIKRVHQFEKVEMYKFTTPESSYDELEALVEAACDISRALKIPFRRLEISTGDLGFSATKKWDVEMWAPGSEEWLEVSSCSNTEDFQARRAAVRYYPEGSKKTQFVHTLNGSGLALPRVIIAIMENYQQADGSVVVPDVLRPYLGTDVIKAE